LYCCHNQIKRKSYFLLFLIHKTFEIQHLYYRWPKCHETKSIHPSLYKAFQGYQEYNLGIYSSKYFIVTNAHNKTNNLIQGILVCLCHWYNQNESKSNFLISYFRKNSKLNILHTIGPNATKQSSSTSLLAKNFPMVLRIWLGDARSQRSQCSRQNKQTNK